VPLLCALAGELGAPSHAAHAVTMTAELSQMFVTKREGVGFIISAVEQAFPGAAIHVYAVDGRFLSADAARADCFSVAAANWSATAHAIAPRHPDAVLIDIGTTTADIIPIADGRVVASGRTDPERLASGELVYSGALRTPVEAIASQVPLGDALAGVSAEGFAIAGDVHTWRGDLAATDYTVPTPDRRSTSRQACGVRLARVVCADTELLDDTAITRIADALAAAQVERLAEAVRRVVDRHPSICSAVVTGLGAFLGVAAARAADLPIVSLASEIGDDEARYAPAVCVGLLLDASLDGAREPNVASSAILTRGSAVESGSRRIKGKGNSVDTVIKLGGGVFEHVDCFNAVLDAIAAVSRREHVLVVPGGGPFADLVRHVDSHRQLSDSAAHWMAILAMDQYAHVIAGKLANAALVVDQEGVRNALDVHAVPVLAPSRWLRDVDPLPHSWEVTSDSIAAWLAGELHAVRLILVKPPGVNSETAVDGYFHAVVPRGTDVSIVAADGLSAWAEARTPDLSIESRAT
jgi:probable H4MPT-linked C1 transfer pathway protein